MQGFYNLSGARFWYASLVCQLSIQSLKKPTYITYGLAIIARTMSIYFGVTSFTSTLAMYCSQRVKTASRLVHSAVTRRNKAFASDGR